MSEPLPMADGPGRAETCGTCRFCEHLDDNDPDCIDGQCLRYPPTIPSTESQIAEAESVTGESGLFYGWWPTTTGSSWCGEWQAKPEPTLPTPPGTASASRRASDPVE